MGSRIELLYIKQQALSVSSSSTRAPSAQYSKLRSMQHYSNDTQESTKLSESSSNTVSESSQNNASDDLSTLLISSTLNDTTNLQQSGSSIFDEQLPFDSSTTGFPTGQSFVLYYGLPLIPQSSAISIYDKSSIKTGNILNITHLGEKSSGYDIIINDSANMRSRTDEDVWRFVGAPVKYRNDTTRAYLIVKYYIFGSWQLIRNSNKVELSLYHNKNTTSSTNKKIATSVFNPSWGWEFVLTGEYTYGLSNNETIDWSTDDFNVNLKHGGTDKLEVKINIEFIWKMIL